MWGFRLDRACPPTHPVKSLLTSADMYIGETLGENHGSPKNNFVQKEINLRTTKCSYAKAKHRDQSRCVKSACIILIN